MRKIILLLISLIAKIDAQLVNGKYEAITSVSCKETTNGGCMTYTYCILDFDKNSVKISHEFESTCSPSDRSIMRQNAKEYITHKYSLIKNHIVIDGFKDYGKFQIKENKLVGKELINYNEIREVIFNKQQIKKDTMKFFDKKRYLENKKANGYEFYNQNGQVYVRQMEHLDGTFSEESTKKDSPNKTYREFHQNASLKKETNFFYNIIIGNVKEYDENGKLIKETDYDKGYKFSLDDLKRKMEREYKVDIMDIKQTHTVDRFQEIYTVLCNQKAKYTFYEYKINGTTGETLSIKIVDGETDKEEIIYEKEKKTSAIYKTHQGVNYTQSEWEAYEEKQYQEYCKRTGRPYTPKDVRTTTEKESSKTSFLAQDGEKGDDTTPKKKGFWDNLLG